MYFIIHLFVDLDDMGHIWDRGKIRAGDFWAITEISERICEWIGCVRAQGHNNMHGIRSQERTLVGVWYEGMRKESLFLLYTRTCILCLYWSKQLSSQLPTHALCTPNNIYSGTLTRPCDRLQIQHRFKPSCTGMTNSMLARALKPITAMCTWLPGVRNAWQQYTRCFSFTHVHCCVSAGSGLRPSSFIMITLPFSPCVPVSIT